MKHIIVTDRLPVICNFSLDKLPLTKQAPVMHVRGLLRSSWLQVKDHSGESVDYDSIQHIPHLGSRTCGHDTSATLRPIKELGRLDFQPGLS